jgi:hypothetical protein
MDCSGILGHLVAWKMYLTSIGCFTYTRTAQLHFLALAADTSGRTASALKFAVWQRQVLRSVHLRDFFGHYASDHVSNVASKEFFEGNARFSARQFAELFDEL